MRRGAGTPAVPGGVGRGCRAPLLLAALLALAAPAPGWARQEVEVSGEAHYGWRLKRMDGSLTSLEEFRGRVLFINMWATWCGPCVRELAGIEALRETLRDTDIAFLLVSPEDPEPVARFVRVHRYDLPVYLEAQEMPAVFGLRALPTTFVVDRGGRIVLRHRGAAEWDQEEVRRFLRALAEGG